MGSFSFSFSFNFFSKSSTAVLSAKQLRSNSSRGICSISSAEIAEDAPECLAAFSKSSVLLDMKVFNVWIVAMTESNEPAPLTLRFFIIGMPVFFFDLDAFLLASGRRAAALGLPVRDTTGADFRVSFVLALFGIDSITFKEPCRLASKEAGSTGLWTPFLDLADLGWDIFGTVAAANSFLGSDFAADVERFFGALYFREGGAGSAGTDAAAGLVFDFDAVFGATVVSVSIDINYDSS